MINFLVEHNASWVVIVIVIGYIIYFFNKSKKEHETHDSLLQIVTIQDITPLYKDENPANNVELVSIEGTKNRIVVKKDLYRQGDKALLIPPGFRLLGKYYIFEEYIRPAGDIKKSKLDENRRVKPVKFDYHTGNYNPVLSCGILLHLSEIAQTMNDFFVDIDEQKKKYTKTHTLMAELKWENGDKEGAIAEYEQAIRIDPNNYLAYSIWGEKLGQKTDNEKDCFGGEAQFLKVIEITTKIINKNPNDAKALMLRGRAHQDLGHIDTAFLDYSKSIEIEPDRETFRNRGYLKFQKIKDLYGALEDYTRAIEMDEFNDFEYFWRGHVKMELNDISGAVEDYTKAIEKNLDDHNDCLYLYYAYRGRSKLQINDVDGTIQDLVKVLDSEPTEQFACETLYQLAVMHCHIPDYSQALKYFNEVIEIYPDYSDAQKLKENLINSGLIEVIQNYKKVTDLDCSGQFHKFVPNTMLFPGLIWVDNQVDTLDVSGYSELEDLSCCYNGLKGLIIKGCTTLTILECSQNEITSLDLSGCTSLTELYCHENKLTSLNLKGCISLTNLICIGNQLTHLDLSDCTALTHLICNENQLTQLDLSNCKSLTNLRCMFNNLTQLNLRNCQSLSTLYCSANQLTQLDLDDCRSLTHFNCTGNQLTRLNFSHCKSIKDIGCGQNQLSTLTLNDLFQNLPAYDKAVIYFEANPGTDSCDCKILERKGWSIYNNDDDEKNAHAYIELGLEKNNNGDIDGAKEAFEKAIEIQPFSYHAHYFLGLTIGGYEGQKYLNKAITICSRIIDNTPNQIGNALLFRGYAYKHMRLVDEALNDFFKVIEINPNQWEAYSCIGDLKYEVYDDLAGAVEAYSLAIKANANNDDTYFKRASMKYKLEDVSGVIFDCTEAIDINQNNIYAYRLRAAAKEKLGLYEGAIEDYSIAIEIAPQYSHCYLGLAEIYYQKDEYGKAMEYVNKALELYPEYKEAHDLKEYIVRMN